MYFTSFAKTWTQSAHMWKSYKQQSVDFSIKNCFIILNHQKHVRLWPRIALKPAKHVLHMILHLENSRKTKLKPQKIMDFSIFRQWKFHVFKRESAGTVLFHVGVYIFSKAIVFYVFCKNLSRIRSQRKELQTKKLWFVMKNAHLRNAYKI